MTTQFKKKHRNGSNSFVAARENCAFFLEFMKHPGKVGSICPSGAALAEELLTEADAHGQGLIIDLGAGSGPVTGHMLRSGIRAERILAIEAIDDFAGPFLRKCPDVPLLIGDARDLKAILDQAAPEREVSAVISSLPFRTMNPETTDKILSEIHAVLRERGGKFVQYSYAWWLQYPLKGNGFIPVAAKTVWNNLPPARVETYRAAGSRAYEKPGRAGWRKKLANLPGYAFNVRKMLQNHTKKNPEVIMNTRVMRFPFLFAVGLALIFMFGVSNSHAAGWSDGAGHTSGGYKGPGPALVTVEQAKAMRDDTHVALKGHIIQSLGDKDYVFKDSTGTITVEISPKRWQGLSIGPDDLVELHGKVDKDWSEIEIEVKRVIKR